jgi:hypothetical protein
MSSCTVRRGFLTLRECGEPAVALCGTCGRPMCVEHLVGDGAGPLCVECSVSQSSSNDSSADSDSGPSDTWRHGYRDDYYRETGYSPPASVGASDGASDGFRTGGTFDDLDKEAFDPALADAGLPLEEDGGPSLFDS